MTSFASFLLVHQKLYGVKYGKHTSTQLFLFYFVVIAVQGFKQINEVSSNPTLLFHFTYETKFEEESTPTYISID